MNSTSGHLSKIEFSLGLLGQFPRKGWSRVYDTSHPPVFDIQLLVPALAYPADRGSGHIFCDFCNIPQVGSGDVSLSPIYLI